MKKIEMPTQATKSFSEVFEMFVISQTAKGVEDITIRNYRYHMKNILRSNVVVSQCIGKSLL